MGTKTRKSTPTRKGRSRTSEIPTTAPIDRLRAILQLYREHAHMVPENTLVSRKTPQEGLTACREFTQWLYRMSFKAGDLAEGEQHAYLLLTDALKSLELQLKPLFEIARELAEKEVHS
jgi:hypothetical protein